MIGLIAFAFSAGMVATVNPCGFAMVPAYLSMLLVAPHQDSTGSPVRSGLRVGLIVTASFVATFSAVGVVFRLVTTSIVNAIPWAALVVGIGLIGAGVAVLGGKHLSLRLRQVKWSRDGSVRSIALFGVAFAVASVSCTLPIFLAVTAAATGAQDPITGIATFSAYGLGMGAVLVTVAIAVASSRDAIVRRIRGLMPYIDRIGGWLLLFSGLFVTYYWLTLLNVDVTSDNPLLAPVLLVERYSAWFTNQIANNAVEWTTAFAVVVLMILVFEMRRARQRGRMRETTKVGP